MNARPPRRLAALLAALALVAACEKKPKRVARTEPWPAPLVASAGTLSSAATRGTSVRYHVTRSNVRFELPTRQRKPSGTIREVTGTIDLDSANLDKTRARLEADLLSLTLGGNGETDSALVARALTWLELGPEREAESRERDRYAVLDIQAFEPRDPASDGDNRRAAQVVAHGTLTLHHFRVPVTLELQVEFRADDAGGGELVSIRTRRPLVVSLAAHDILPRDARGNVLTSELPSVGRDVGREVRVSAELEARIASP